MTFASTTGWSVVLVAVVSLCVAESPWRTRMHDYKNHPCIRTCHDNAVPLVCEYDFVIEHYYTLTQACRGCPFNQSECSLPHCIAADGVSRGLMTVNRMMPGPAIHVCFGDTILVNVINKLEGAEATTIHWHGVLQEGTPHMDGVAMITQCPIHSHSSFQYRFKANTAGTHYWHAHAGLQRGDGIFGALVIRQPLTRDVQAKLYDYDLPEHTMVVHDWMTEASATRFAGHHHAMTEHQPNSILINGKGSRKPFANEPPRHHGDHSAHDYHMPTPPVDNHAQHRGAHGDMNHAFHNSHPPSHQDHFQHNSHMNHNTMHNNHQMPQQSKSSTASSSFMDASNSRMPTASDTLAHRGHSAHSDGHGTTFQTQSSVEGHQGHNMHEGHNMMNHNEHVPTEGQNGFKVKVQPQEQKIESVTAVTPTQTTQEIYKINMKMVTPANLENANTNVENGLRNVEMFGSFNKAAALKSQKQTAITPSHFQSGQQRDLLAALRGGSVTDPSIHPQTTVPDPESVTESSNSHNGHHDHHFTGEGSDGNLRAKRSNEHSRVKRGSENGNGECDRSALRKGENKKIFTPHAVFEVTPGFKYRFRIISNGVNNCPLQISVDNHTILAIASDGAPFRPLEVDSINLFAGERYDVIVHANQPSNNYWIRARGLADCGSDYKSVSQTAILRYKDAADTLPEACEDYKYAIREGKKLNPTGEKHPTRDEINIADLESALPKDIVLKPIPDRLYYLAMDFNMVENHRFHDPDFYPLDTTDIDVNSAHVHHMTTPQINHISWVSPSAPPLTQYDFIAGTFCDELKFKLDCKKEFCECTHRMKVRLGEVIELVLIDEGKFMDNNHPMHLHGHNFRVIGMGKLNSSTTAEEVKALDRSGLIKRNLNKAIVKDTVNVPDGGYTIIRFHANNPGFWMLHCHVAFHMEMGMSMLIQVGEVMEMPPPPKFFPQCGNWHTGIQHAGRTENRYCDPMPPSYPPTHPPLRPLVLTSPVPIRENRIPSGVTVPTKNQLQQSRSADTDVDRPAKPNPQPLIPLSITMQNLQNNRRGDQDIFSRRVGPLSQSLALHRIANTKDEFLRQPFENEQPIGRSNGLNERTQPPQVLELPVSNTEEHPHYISNFNPPLSAKMPPTEPRNDSNIRKLMLLWLSGRQNGTPLDATDSLLEPTTPNAQNNVDIKKIVKPNRVLSMNPLLFTNGNG